MKVQDKIEMLEIAALVPYARNSRTHSKEQIAQIARSIQEFGFTNPVLIDGHGGIVAGHGRVLAAQSLGVVSVPCLRVDWLNEAQKRAYVIADNQLALQAGWDNDILAAELRDLQALDYNIDLTGFAADEVAELLAEIGAKGKGEGAADATPAVKAEAISKPGDVWMLGKHRVMCGDSTSAADVATLMDGKKAALIHADPPYGMGKEGDGVANDNLYREKLDAFQMAWWRTFRKHADDNASAYIWGNAPDLWRLWYCGGLEVSERLTIRNQIIWDKPPSAGPWGAPIGSYKMRSFPHGYEVCLYFMLGQQSFGNVNSEDYWEGWEPFRLYLLGEAEKMGWGQNDIKRICGVGMWGHWFTKSQWSLIPEKHYIALQQASEGKAFCRSYIELKSGASHARSSGGHLDAKRDFDAMRAYFDNTHDNMTDVWEFSRVTGDDRHGHATPKPVAMMERVMRSSLPGGGLCAEPFGGSGSTLMGAEVSGRICYTMELQPNYVDVIIRRWQQYTGQRAIHAATGKPFPAVE